MGDGTNIILFSGSGRLLRNSCVNKYRYLVRFFFLTVVIINYTKLCANIFYIT